MKRVRNFLTALALVAVTFVGTSTVANAGQFSISFSTAPWWQPVPGYPVMIGYDTYGAFCSGYSADGQWGFSYGYYNTNMHCGRVNQYLVNQAGQPAMRLISGSFLTYGYNQVTVACKNFNYSWTGPGTQALEAVLQRAQASGASFCHFAVRYW